MVKGMTGSSLTGKSSGITWGLKFGFPSNPTLIPTKIRTNPTGKRISAICETFNVNQVRQKPFTWQRRQSNAHFDVHLPCHQCFACDKSRYASSGRRTIWGKGSSWCHCRCGTKNVCEWDLRPKFESTQSRSRFIMVNRSSLLMRSRRAL